MVVAACYVMYGELRRHTPSASAVRNTQCAALAGMVCNPEFIIQGLLGLQLAWHRQAFLLGDWGVGRPFPLLSIASNQPGVVWRWWW